MFRIRKLIRKQEPRWRVTTKGGVMFRECSSTGRLQYRECGTNRWVEVDGRHALSGFMHQAQEVSGEEPAWVRNRKPEK